MPLGISTWRIDVADDASKAEKARALKDAQLAKRFGEHLDRHYPGYHFRIDVDSPGGVVFVSLPVLMPTTMKEVVHLSQLNGDPTLSAITRAGGRLLEGFRLPRGKYREDLWREAKEKNWMVKHARTGVLRQVDLSTGKVKLVVPDALQR
jgi:hypothetical protein